MRAVPNQHQLKQAVAKAALVEVAPLVRGAVIGIGSGSTVELFIDELAALRDSIAGAVSSSNRSSDRLRALGIKLLDLNDVERYPIYVDGADEVDPRLCLIKGGGAALTREKIVAAVAERFVCIVDQSKCVASLGRFALPIEVIPLAREYVARRLRALGGQPRLRAGVTTDNGNQILDVAGLSIDDPSALETEINQIVGVVCNGIFALRRADLLLVATEQGIERRTA